jgi:hypothetical protein
VVVSDYASDSFLRIFVYENPVLTRSDSNCRVYRRGGACDTKSMASFHVTHDSGMESSMLSPNISDRGLATAMTVIPVTAIDCRSQGKPSEHQALNQEWLHCLIVAGKRHMCRSIEWVSRFHLHGQSGRRGLRYYWRIYYWPIYYWMADRRRESMTR